MPLKPVVKKQSLHRESLPLRLNWIVPMTKGQQLAVSFTYHPGLDDTDVVSASIDQAISKETMKETKEMINEDPFLEYRIPEPLLDPQTMTKDNILQFRIPIYRGVSVDAVIGELIKEASVLLGSNVNLTESATRRLKENTITCLQNNVFEYF